MPFSTSRFYLVGIFLFFPALQSVFGQMLTDCNHQPINVPADWTKEQTQQAIFNVVSEIAARSMPGCTIKQDKGELRISWRVSEVQGYMVGKSVDYPKTPRTYTGPVDDGLDLQIFFWPESTVPQAGRPQILKKYGGVPWDTLLGPQIELKGLKTQITFNLSYGPKTAEGLRQKFSDPHLWVQIAIEMSNQPQHSPAAPPTEKMFSNLTPQEIIQWFQQENSAEIQKKLILSNKKKDDIVCGIEAASWFIWKTRDMKESEKLREKLADVLKDKILNAQSDDPIWRYQDCRDEVGILYMLNAKKQIEELFSMLLEKKPPYLDSSFTPALLMAWADLGGKEGLLRICKIMNNGGIPWPNLVEETLIQTTGHTVPQKDGKPDQQAWLEYCKKQQMQKP